MSPKFRNYGQKMTGNILFGENATLTAENYPLSQNLGEWWKLLYVCNNEFTYYCFGPFLTHHSDWWKRLEPHHSYSMTVPLLHETCGWVDGRDLSGKIFNAMRNSRCCREYVENEKFKLRIIQEMYMSIWIKFEHTSSTSGRWRGVQRSNPIWFCPFEQ